MASSLWRAAMGRRGAAATLSLHLMVVATLALAAATFMSTAEALGCKSMAQEGSSRSGRFRVPEGGEDGLYIGSVEVDEQGVEQYRVTFLGTGKTTLDGRWANNNVSRAATGGLGRKLLEKDSGPHCEGKLNLDAHEVLGAVTKLADVFGYDGHSTVPSFDSVFAVYGCAVAYVCNYNNVPLRVFAGVLWTNTYSLNEACTVFNGGWFAHESTRSANGRTYVTTTFCY